MPGPSRCRGAARVARTTGHLASRPALGVTDTLARHFEGILAPGSTRLSGVWNQILDPSPTPSAPTLGADHGGDLLEGLWREGRPHLVVSGLVPTDAGDRPDLGEEAGTVRVHGERPSVEPLDPAIAARDKRITLGVLFETEA